MPIKDFAREMPFDEVDLMEAYKYLRCMDAVYHIEGFDRNEFI